MGPRGGGFFPLLVVRAGKPAGFPLLQHREFYTPTKPEATTNATAPPPAYSSSLAAPSSAAFFDFFFFFFFLPFVDGAGVAFAAGSGGLASSCFLQLSGQFCFMKAAFDLHSPLFAQLLQ